jgi:hypothetical protein
VIFLIVFAVLGKSTYLSFESQSLSFLLIGGQEVSRSPGLVAFVVYSGRVCMLSEPSPEVSRNSPERSFSHREKGPQVVCFACLTESLAAQSVAQELHQ